MLLLIGYFIYFIVMLGYWGDMKKPFADTFIGYVSKPYLSKTNISPENSIFEDDFPFPKVGYVIVPQRVFLGTLRSQAV